MAFKNENVRSGLPRDSKFQVGRADADSDKTLEENISLPWASEPAGSYLYYECMIGIMLDSGIVVHNRLPQVNRAMDTLGSSFTDAADLDTITNKGVNLNCQDQYTDIVQRMGHARYWFRVWGQAMRIGYQIPIPKLKTIGGVAAIPYDKNPQWAYNAICPDGNYSGLILWRAQWSLWYTTVVPPVSQSIPLADPSAHIRGDTQPPTKIQSAFSDADDNAEKSLPPLRNITVIGKT